MALKKPNSVYYFAAVMYNPKYMDRADEIFQELFGEIVLRSIDFNFDHTKYYEPEMGEKLIKYFAAFGAPSDPALLPDYKLKAIDKENELSFEGKRVINIDPGYLAIEKVVVASTKNFTHRIYLRDGIFGDLQLMRQKGIYCGMPWTYADYLRPEAEVFFNSLAKLCAGGN